jgi:hypothetical protein
MPDGRDDVVIGTSAIRVSVEDSGSASYNAYDLLLGSTRVFRLS